MDRTPTDRSVVCPGKLDRGVSQRRRFGFSLVELLASMSIVALLIGLLLTAVSGTRDAARRMACQNNLRQIGLAVRTYEAAQRSFPPSFLIPRGRLQIGSWSIHGRLLPYLEDSAASARVNLDRDWHEQVHSGVPPLRVETYLCPSDPNPVVRFKNGQRYVHPQTYGFNLGTWFIYDPVTNRSGDGAFAVNVQNRLKDIRDGLSKTMCAADVKAYTSYVRNTGDPGPAIPDSPQAFAGFDGELKLGPTLNDNTGHTVWCDGRVHHAGFTTVFAPNTVVTYEHQGISYDIDFNSQQEGKSLVEATFAAVTARSYHSGMVNVVLLDGAVRTVADEIDKLLWRAMGTRSAGD